MPTTISQISELDEIAQYVGDEQLTEALEVLVKLILKPDIPPQVAVYEIVRLQAIAAKLKMRGVWMANVDKTGNRAIKNLYYAAADELDKLVSALKFSVKI